MKRRILSIFMALLMLMSAVFISGSAASLSSLKADAAGETTEPTGEKPEEPVGEWIGAWGSGMTNITFPDYENLFLSLSKVAARIVLTPTASGNQMRLRISNVFGKNDLVISGMFVHYSEGGTKVTQLSATPVYYNGNWQIKVPAGTEIVTDPIKFNVVAGKDIAVTMYLGDAMQDITTLGLSGAKTYIALGQDVPDALEDFLMSEGNFYSFSLSSKLLSNIIPSLSNLPEINVVPFLSGIDVFNTEEDPYSVVVIGDSTVSNNFPLYLAKAIQAENCTSVGVVGKGIFGNSLLADGQGKIGNIYGPSVLHRMDIDLLQQSGVRYAVIKVGANDITHPESASIKDYGNYVQPTSAQLIAGFKKFAQLCHDYDIKVIGCTITQWKGATRDYFGSNGIPEYEWKESDWKIAQDVNKWMKTSKDIDGYIDLAALSAGSDTAQLRGDWTSDFIHPNDKAQQEWAKEFPLEKIGIKTVPSYVRIAPSAITLAVGKTYQLEEVIFPETAALTDVTWKSSKPTVVSVNADGTIKALKNGSATITCTTVNGKTAKCVVTVKTPVTGVTLNKSTLSIYETETAKLTATVKPSSAENKSVKWVSDNEGVAKVSSKGTVTGVKYGTAVISCITNDGAKRAVCIVTVKKRVAVKGLTFKTTSKTVYKGKTYQITPVFNPTNASNKTLKWTSTDPDIATVSSDGKVTAVKNGTAYIYAVTQDGSYTAACKITVKTHASSVKLNTTYKKIYIGKTYTLKATVSPSTATNKSVSWSSSNKSIATVSSKGVVTGKKAGTVTITCKTADGGYKATCKIKVTKFYKVKSVSLNKKSVTLEGGEKYQLKATINPSYASEQGLSWKSSNSRVARVSSTGKVTALKKGSATITCTTKSGKKTAQCKIKVVSTPASGVTLNKKTLRLSLAETYRLKATVEPLDATYTGVTWKSSNKSIAKVSSTGKVTAVSTGSCTISCITDDGDFVAKCKVTVVDDSEEFDIEDVKGEDNDGGDSFTTVKLSKASISLSKGSKYTLKATISPASKAKTGVTWSSDNKSVATVSSSGVVTAVGKGKCKIKCKANDGGWIATCEVTVS